MMPGGTGCVTSQPELLVVPFLADIIRRDEKRVIKRFNLCFAISADASLESDLGASSEFPSISESM
jgi:hypothetical protein